MSTTHLTDITFDSLPIHALLKKSIADQGYHQCTPIQAGTLPYSLCGKDVAGQAQTGTGKSAAFLIATLHRLLTAPSHNTRHANQPRAIILAPTRELALQIYNDGLALANPVQLKLAVAFGGEGYVKQKQTIEAGVDVLVGTPGRIIDYMKKQILNLKQCDVVVLDEADRMFDLGFISDIRYILRRCPAPEKRLSMLFSATLSQKVQELAYEHMNAPEQITIQTDTVASDNITQTVYQPAKEEKIPLLLGLYAQLAPERSVVFVNTKHAADNVWRYCTANNIPAALLSGDVPQHKRSKLMQKFQAGEFNTLIATDVASRGLHIDGITHVFNYDLPALGEDYIHRIGRTARAGARGMAISFACEDTAFNLIDIEMYIEASLPKAKITEGLLLHPKPPAPRKPNNKNRTVQRARTGRQRNVQQPRRQGRTPSK